MEREEIRNKIMGYFNQQVAWIKANPNNAASFNMVHIYELFPRGSEPSWKHKKVYSVAREIVQELITNGFLYPGNADDFNSSYPSLTITEYGKGCVFERGLAAV